jgi:sugar phosphate isomerase/epimerase
MELTLVGVATSAYGADLVREYGQAHFVPIVARAGAAAIEIRRELFTGDDLGLDALRKVIEAERLFSVYSAPVELWDSEGVLNRDLMEAMLAEASQLGALFLKVSLGHFEGESDLAALKRLREQAPVPFAIENDQTRHGGRIEPVARFLAACREAEIPLGLTFDMGNWRWTGCDVDQAADSLASYVTYVHCKGVHDDNGKHRAVPLEAGDPGWRALFGRFPHRVLRSIEFPLIGDDLEAVTRRYVELVGSA